MSKTTVYCKVNRKQTIAYLKQTCIIAPPVRKGKKPKKNIDKLCSDFLKYSAQIDALLAQIRSKLRRE